MKELFEKVVTAVYLSCDNQIVAFIIENVKPYTAIIYNCEAECCSNTWIESIDNPEVLIKEKIKGIESRDGINISGEEDDVLMKYGFTLKTDKGYCDIDFRNASNGYYGGDLYYDPELTLKVDPETKKVWVINNRESAVEMKKIA